MSRSRKLLLLSGFLLILLGMTYGLYYALFDEHQTLEQMGVSLAEGFAAAAQRDLPTAHERIATYAATRFEYVREVHVHSHWGGLAMLLILFGLLFDRVGRSEPRRFLLACLFAAGALLYPLGVILQTALPGPLPAWLAGLGTAMLLVAFTAVAFTLVRQALADTPPPTGDE